MDTVEEKRESIYRKMKKLQAYREVENLMGRCVFAFNYQQKEGVLSYLAMEEPDVSVELADEGLYIGAEAVRDYADWKIPEAPRPGELTDIHISCPIIEVAQDGLTAKGLWLCPGEGALLHGEEDPQAIWMWGTLAADFKLVGDVWKIWHLHYFRLMKCDYQKGWVKDTSLENKLNASMPRSARPTTYHNPYTPYTIRDCIPGIPHPYTSYEESDKDWMLHNEKAF